MTGNGHGRTGGRRPTHRPRSLLYARPGRRGHRALPPHLLRRLRRRPPAATANALRILAAFALAAVGVLVVVLGSTAAAAAVAWSTITQDLPSVEEANGLPFATTKIYDRNWVLLNQLSDPQTGWRTPVSYQEIRDHITQQQSDPNAPHRAWIFDATVAAEDATFWSNPGFDPVAITRSFVLNLQGGPPSGASTITQQLVRLLHPDTIGFERSYVRKIREAVVAYQYTRHYSKEQILEMYLNNVYYGQRAYGIDAAAETYFNKHPWELTLAEAALLAGLPQAPSLYDPAQNFELAKARQRYVLEQMVEQGMITQAEADAAYAEPLNLQIDNNRNQVLRAPHFVNFVRSYLEQKFGAATLYRGGLVVRTTLDLGLQEAAQRIVSEQVARLRPWDANNGALVAMLPWSGEIVAMVGSADYYNESIDGQVNVAVQFRQPGSSIKPVTYLAAFERGWNPGTIIFDYNKRWPLPGQPGKYYQPQNYTGQRYGAVSVRTALANSLNTPAVQTLAFVGVQNMIDLAHKMGIQRGLWRGPSVYGLAVTLGGGEVTLLEHTNVFATLANNGRYVPYTPLLEVTDQHGTVLYRLDRANALAQGAQVVKAEHAYQMTDILSDNQARALVFGTRTPLTLPELGNRPVAAKTGTTNDWKDGWTMGYTTALAVGVWVGNTDGRPTRYLDGVQGAAPIWHDFMVAAHTDPRFAQTLLGPDGQPVPPEFPRPPGIYEGPVCAATGKQPIPGVRTITEVLVRGEGPTLPCNRTTPEEAADLRAALADAGRSRNFTSRGLQSLYEYAAAVGLGRRGP
ncbi:MAG: transglycosylase domain-containing protein [Sphaerobacter sp.]|nr:transglycosylase domain-containing protein [Sphaerobacter sp.]